jgi:class 3 adenylate cyclase
MNAPETQYAVSEGVHIAWQVFGTGSVDVVFVPGWFSNVELTWENPWQVRFFSRLTSFARVILFDKRGTGLSDRETAAFTLEDRMDDVRTVMDAARSSRAVLMGRSEGGPMCALFAATYPDRTTSLVMIGSYARRVRTHDYPWGASPVAYAALLERMEADWGSAIDISSRAPSLAHDEAFLQHYTRYLRMSASPATAVKYARMNGEIDVRDVLPLIRIPTLILHATGDRVIDIGNARYLASKISGARLREIDSRDHLCDLTEHERVLDEIEEFVTGHRSEPPDQSMVTTILFTDIVGSTQLAAKLGDRRWADLLGAHHAEVRNLLTRYRGVEVKSTGDGFHAIFDGPARAIRCARQLQESVAKLGLELRVGLHTGECVITRDGLEGIAVHIAARVAQNATAGEIVVSQTVRDLVAGSGIEFEPRGEHQLRGVPDAWRLYSVSG